MSASLLMTTFIAYLGPGGIFSTIGGALALIGALILAVFGFVWYPLKRLLRARKVKSAPTSSNADNSEEAQA